MKRLVAILCAALVLMACAPDVGRVVEKRYTPARSWTSLEPVYGTNCRTTAQGSRCSQTIIYWHNVNHYSPESYDVKITDGKDTGWVTVNPALYERIHVGDTYNSKTGEVQP